VTSLATLTSIFKRSDDQNPRGNTLLEICTPDIRISKISVIYETDIKRKLVKFQLNILQISAQYQKIIIHHWTVFRVKNLKIAENSHVLTESYSRISRSFVLEVKNVLRAPIFLNFRNFGTTRGTTKKLKSNSQISRRSNDFISCFSYVYLPVSK